MTSMPDFDTMLTHYPTTSDPHDVLRSIDPKLVTMPAYQNTCAMRLSQALNSCRGHEIAKRPGLLTVKGVDGKLYAVRVAEMKNYLRLRYGQPAVVLTASSSGVIDAASIRDKMGIIAFDVSGWSDASGHFTLWDSERLLYAGGHDYFHLYEKRADGGVTRVTQCSLWVCS